MEIILLTMILGATILLAVYIGKIFKHKQPTESKTEDLHEEEVVNQEK